ncbi:MAG: Type IV pilus assembly protein PilM [Parcubacteria group bacterium Gr01-1014_8]|nr:MAG: Type IV pilus assembly protein PilM [Parcubacteria group bacterium Gr01-1014_8]
MRQVIIHGMNLTRGLARWFPTPSLLAPRAAGIDITDGSIKWVTLAKIRGATRVASYGYETLSPGIVVNGAVRDVKALASALSGLKKKLGASHAHAALPEEGAYVFSMSAAEGSSRRDIRSTIEFELEGRVPIPISQAVYDYDHIEDHHDGSGSEIAVAVFPRELADGYAAAFEGAGIHLSSLEIEARSIGRAISEGAGEPITMLVDAGKARTGISILKRGIPIFTSTVEVGGGNMSEVIMQTLALSEPDAEKFKNEQGLIVTDKNNAKGAEALEKIAAALAAEVVRHYHFWDTRRNEHGERVTPIEQVLLVGGSANLKGITDYIAGKVQAPTDRPNVWRNVCSFDDYIPPIDRRVSLQYATSIGLALRGVSV